MPIIRFKDVWEMYRVKFMVEGKSSWEDFWALRGIDFSIAKGEIVGIIGENGSGKSTVLRLIAGMLQPDRGQVDVAGSVSGLLELGAGFQTELTGRENIILQFGLFGLHADRDANKLRQVIDFAEIGKFIDAPVKCYSQGMFVRLAFAIAIHMDPDIFLVDDTLSVGDEYFQKKCIKEIFKIKEKGKTIIIVTHDMAMLQKLCARSIFLKQGELIKDGETSRVASFYSQTVGSPRGIGVIEKGRLGLVFNNGRLLLSWDGKLFTLPRGAYTSSLAEGVWYNSSQAEWDVEASAGKITAGGRFYHLAMSQVWRIEVTDDCEVKWEIEVEMDNDAPLPEIYINTALVDGYNKWFADTETGIFPEINEEDKYWKPISLKNVSSACVGVHTRGDLPSIIFEQLHSGYRAQAGIFNSDYVNPGRILQHKTSPFSGASVKQPGRCICFSGKITVGLTEIDAYVRKAQSKFIVSSGKLKLVFDSGRLALFFEGIPLTKAGHMHSAFFMNQKWFTSDSAVWTLKKEAENRMVAAGDWPDLGISQTWLIDVQPDNSFVWNVDMETRQASAIEQQRLRCFFSEGFYSFFGEFISERFGDKFSDMDVDLLKRCVASGTVGLQGAASSLPSISLSFASELGNFVKIFNSDYYNKARILHLEKVEPETGVLFNPGRHACFKARFSVNKNSPETVSNPEAIIEESNVKFIFYKGNGRLYNGLQEITKNIALYTSMRSGGRWFDSSSSARWKIISKNIRELRASGRWMDLPLLQEWEVKINGQGVFEWKVNLIVEKEVEFDRLQANVMFSEKFLRWTAEKEGGVFPEFRGDVDDDWDCLWSAKCGERRISLQENPVYKLPEVSLFVLEPNPRWSLKIINSDIYHRGRVLQYASSLETKFTPGDYRYFSGAVTIKNK